MGLKICYETYVSLNENMVVGIELTLQGLTHQPPVRLPDSLFQ